MFIDATDHDIKELFPEAEKELPTMFKQLSEFSVSEDGMVKLGEETQMNMESVKGDYLITPEDRKRKREKTAIFAKALPDHGIQLLD